MNNKKKKILYTIIDLIGYGMGITLSLNTANILINILESKSITIGHSWWTPFWWKPTLLAEIGLVFGSFGFFIYKFIKNMIDREKLLIK